MTQTGKMDGQNFLPIAGVNPEDIFERIKKGVAGWSDLDGSKTPAAANLVQAQKEARDDIKRAYAWLLNQPQGKIIIEDILDQTLRRGSSHPDPAAGIEQEALYSRERKGQNSFVIFILRQAYEGMNLPAPGAAKRKSRKSK